MTDGYIIGGGSDDRFAAVYVCSFIFRTVLNHLTKLLAIFIAMAAGALTARVGIRVENSHSGQTVAGSELFKYDCFIEDNLGWRR